MGGARRLPHGLHGGLWHRPDVLLLQLGHQSPQQGQVPADRGLHLPRRRLCAAVLLLHRLQRAVWPDCRRVRYVCSPDGRRKWRARAEGLPQRRACQGPAHAPHVPCQIVWTVLCHRVRAVCWQGGPVHPHRRHHRRRHLRPWLSEHPAADRRAAARTTEVELHQSVCQQRAAPRLCERRCRRRHLCDVWGSNRRRAVCS
mmetsp:Transcript_19892/g.59081  ORF Transcript_19892/g.59081 Transcript_19892/m.59081 type:complete len:200 (-) Transcript_19892:1493-2092(-)